LEELKELRQSNFGQHVSWLLGFWSNGNFMLVFEEKDAGDVFVDLSLYHRIILKEDY
jgi:hypothetical protein